MSEHTKGLLITAFGVVVLSPDALLFRMVDVELWTFLFWRGLLLAAALTVGLVVIYRDRFFATVRGLGRYVLILPFLFSGTTILFISALSLTTIANAVIIVSAAPLVAALLSRFVLGEQVPRRTWVAIAFALAGIAITTSGSVESGTGRESLAGDAAALGAALFLASTFIVIRRARAVQTLPGIVLGSLLTSLVSLVLAGSLAVPADDVVWLLLLCLLFLPLSTAMINTGPRYLPAQEVSLLILLESVLGPLWVWMVLGEVPSVEAFVGGSLVLGTLAVHAVQGVRRQAP